MTWINAPMERCFKLSTSIDLHMASVASTAETVIDGKTTGLIGKGEMVTFRGRHFGLKLKHTSRIDGWRPYHYFRDVMIDGAFAHYEHEHHFAIMDDGTRMQDLVRFSAPLGPLGGIATKMLVRKHLLRLLQTRNAEIKRVAESEEWHRYLDGRPEIRLESREPTAVVTGWDKKRVAQPG